MVFSKKEQNFHLEKTEKMAYICIKNILISLSCAQFSGRSTVNSIKRGLKKPVQLRIFFIKLSGTCEQKISIYEGLFLLKHFTLHVFVLKKVVIFSLIK